MIAGPSTDVVEGLRAPNSGAGASAVGSCAGASLPAGPATGSFASGARVSESDAAAVVLVVGDPVPVGAASLPERGRQAEVARARQERQCG